MSAEQERQARAMMLLDYVESKQRLLLLQEQAHSLGIELEGLSRLLQDDPQNISIASYGQLLDNKRLNDLVADISEAFTETERLRMILNQLGLDV